MTGGMVPFDQGINSKQTLFIDRSVLPDEEQLMENIQQTDDEDDLHPQENPSSWVSPSPGGHLGSISSSRR
jgi:hypothetical protein